MFYFAHRLLRRSWLLAVCLALAACGAAAPRVSYDYDPAADFAGFKQFAWAEPVSPRRGGDPLADNSLLDDRIKSVIEHQLLLKGIRRADGPGADFRVAFQITLRRQRVSIPAADPYGPFYPYGMGFGYGRYPGYYGAWNMPGAYWEEYETRGLIVDFLHPATAKQLWRGILDDALDLSNGPAEQKYQLDGKVQYLFRNFPPGAQN